MAIAAALLAACGAAPGGPNPDLRGWVSGHLYSWPSCPVQTAENPCPPRPVGGARIDFRRDGGRTVVVLTDGTGAYTVRLQPGTYGVQVELPRPVLRGRTGIKRAARDRGVADLPIDSGIR